ncbi:MAG TPA: hypothetical protein VLI04_16130 [Nocardioidaceae bacterium]|nr:hypothetical protein [Nocardioidaceae bacterium]
MTDSSPDLAARKRVGSGFLWAASTWVLYIVLAFSLAADYETALEDAAEATDTPVNKLPAETLAQISQDHPWINVSSVALLLAPAIFVMAIRRAAAVTGDRWAVPLAWLGAAVWWFYMLLNFGLAFDPQDLPPLTRDLDVLTVPLVSVASLLITLSFISAAWSLRSTGWRPKASAVAALIALALLVLSAVTLVGSGGDEPLIPVVLLPPELILGIALVTSKAKQVEPATP